MNSCLERFSRVGDFPTKMLFFYYRKNHTVVDASYKEAILWKEATNTELLLVETYLNI